MGMLMRRLKSVLFPMFIAFLMFFAFHVENGSPIEQGIWVMASLCFIQLNLVLTLLVEPKDGHDAI